ncbi:MAG: hypothetical protein QX197_09400 [Methylococcaceae bacterium]
MKSVIEYLDDLKEITGSDYKSAKMLNIQKTSVSMIRSRGKMSDETAIKMAELLGINKDEVLMAATIARSHGEVKASWERISKLSGLAASILMTCILVGYNAKEADAGVIYNLTSYSLCEVLDWVF